MPPDSPIGFIGLGTMGAPMALNLAQANTPLVAWNRTASRCGPVEQAGATIASDAADLFARCETVILMLENDTATDAVLCRHGPDFAPRITGHTIVSMSTVSADYSKHLSDDIRSVGGRYVEAPVSGSRKPAEAGHLVGMLAGDPQDCARLRTILGPVCKEIFDCGAVPAALHMKLAINTFLITMVTGLAEAAHFAERHDLDMNRFIDILNAGPMASDVSRVKLEKIARHDFTRQAGISDVLKNNRLVVEAARHAGIASPLMDVCLALYGETEGLGLAENDMISVLRAIAARTERTAAGTGRPPHDP